VKLFDFLFRGIGKAIARVVRLLGFRSFHLRDFEEEGVGFVVAVIIIVTGLVLWGDQHHWF